ncbi:biotin/lipoyl-containing protein [Streptococcus caviae]|uniref:biotin/lipoyl-containing protein n=1 Tax=Streptococcus sp. 'caviae' TaxID=1915004 RepID=UPI00094B7FBB|nr:biotin/lipoyl-containing protein [Streptococcus sp. 'caviae']OLN84823.1 hypothetical protein BMI76_01725 [Streptococcus sp. 'caviae']
MKTYEVNVNGDIYIVSLRELDAAEASAPLKQTAAPTPAPAAADSSDGYAIQAPMAGKILQIHKAVGDTVKAGDMLFTLEAMKMETPIQAPRDGVVAAIAVSANQTVNTDDLLMTI